MVRILTRSALGGTGNYDCAALTGRLDGVLWVVWLLTPPPSSLVRCFHESLVTLGRPRVGWKCAAGLRGGERKQSPEVPC